LNRLGGAYEALPLSYVNGERADLVFEVVADKVTKYGVNTRSAIHLLLYATDFRLSLDSDLLDLVAYRVSRETHCFRSVLYFEPAGKVEVQCGAYWFASHQSLSWSDG
jgi:hypothetical protein